MSRYLVKLKPVGAFFFGGERIFSFYEKGMKFKNNIIKSREFPQQTSILGMIRKEILVLNKLIREKWDYKPEQKGKIKKLIGEKSFDIAGSNEDFGIINSISPVFIVEEIDGVDRFLIKVPKDHNQNKNYNNYVPLKFNDDKGNCLKVKTDLSKEVYLPIDFDAKKGLSDDFVDIEKGNIISRDKVFIKDSSIGIRLDEKHIAQENSLFRLEKYKFNYDKDYEKENKCFAFILDIEDDKESNTSFENYRNVVALGGEGSYFSISLEKITFDIKEKINFVDKQKVSFIIEEKMPCEKEQLLDKKEIYKIILLSDTYISKRVYEENCMYSISKRIDFRSLKSENYNENKQKGNAYYNRFDKSKNRYSFLEKGSVLFAYKTGYDELLKSINNSKLQKIGYNIFI
ncbi:CRISPR-associated protein Cmr3 [Clostridium liquoris]|uniref:CRISPR-associated protein Cmr3 n=2 Tax=Clostridium liquoris TaxID=1289519 RepID=A0A2T0B222_9CLOT|nr:CRISPR-associated protein Cmr3 [Clostridium liquoris]